MMVLNVIADIFRQNAPVIIGAAVVGSVAVGGYQSHKYVESKQGVIIHDQGYEMIKQANGKFRMWVGDGEYPNDGRLQDNEYDLYNNPREFTNAIAQVGKNRFPNTDASSYADIYLGDSIFKYVNYDRYTVHAALFNSPTIGQCIIRTNDPVLNEMSTRSFMRNQHQISDTLMERYGYPLMFSLYHEDVDEKGWKKDPRPQAVRDLLEENGYRYDNRPDILK